MSERAIPRRAAITAAAVGLAVFLSVAVLVGFEAQREATMVREHVATVLDGVAARLEVMARDAGGLADGGRAPTPEQLAELIADAGGSDLLTTTYVRLVLPSGASVATSEAGPAGVTVSEVIVLPGGVGRLDAVMVQGWSDLIAPPEQLILLVGLFMAAIGAWLTSRVMTTHHRLDQVSGKLRDVVQALDVPVIEWGPDGVVVGWNPAAASRTGMPATVAIGRHMRSVLRELLHPDDADALVDDHDGEVVRGRERRVRLRDGRQLALVVNITVLRDDAGVPAGYVGVAQDITELRHSQELAARNAAVARAAHLKDEFLAGISHELRTPLNSILGLSDLLGAPHSDPLTVQQRQYVGGIQESAAHLRALVDDVLDLAKSAADRQELKISVVDLDHVIDTAVRFLRETAVAQGLTVSWTPGVEVVVDGDERRLTQTLMNLLSNAVKFTPEGGSIGVTVERDDATAVIEVWDTGIGIPEDQIELLFQPFQQLDSSLSRRHGGTGLGLALSSEFVRLHGGDITVTSVVGEGSRFRIRLPVTATAGGEAGAAAIDPSRHRAPGTAGEDDPVPDGIRLLLVDDHDLNRGMLGGFLTQRGIEVIEATDGIEAVDLAIEHLPDVILMDIQLPGRDGLVATRMLRQDVRTRHLAIVACTALAMKGDRELCLAAGCDRYLSKPITPREVLGVVLDVVAGGRGSEVDGVAAGSRGGADQELGVGAATRLT